MSDVADFDWLAAQVAGRRPLYGDDEWEFVPKSVEGLRDPDNYPPDWDGRGSDPVDQECLTGMVAFLAHLKANGFPPPYVLYPACDGEIFAEWAFDYPGENYVRVVSEVNRRNLSRADTIICFGVGREPVYTNIEF